MDANRLERSAERGSRSWRAWLLPGTAILAVLGLLASAFVVLGRQRPAIVLRVTSSPAITPELVPSNHGVVVGPRAAVTPSDRSGEGCDFGATTWGSARLAGPSLPSSSPPGEGRHAELLSSATRDGVLHMTFRTDSTRFRVVRRGADKAFSPVKHQVRSLGEDLREVVIPLAEVPPASVLHVEVDEGSGNTMRFGLATP